WLRGPPRIWQADHRTASRRARRWPIPSRRPTRPRERRVTASFSSDDYTKILVTEEQISAKLDELAAQIREDYAGKDLLLVGVLKGAVMVMADLARRMPPNVQMDWMAVS